VGKLRKKVLKPKKEKLSIHHTSLIGSEELNFSLEGFRVGISISIIKKV
jgi:hypothetical protein